MSGVHLKEYSVIGRIVYLLGKIGIRPVFFLIPIGLSLFAALFEGVGIGLLIPILNGFFQKSFSFLMEIPVLSSVLEYLPDSVLNNDRMLFGVLLGCFVCIYVLKNIIRYTSTVSVIYFAQRSIHHLRKAMFSRYLSFGKLFFDTSNVGHHNTLLLEFSREALAPLTIIGQVINALFSMTVYFVIMLMISWKLTLVALPLFFVLHWAIRSMVLRIKGISKHIVRKGSDMGKKSVEILSTIPLVKSYNSERMEQDRYTAISDEKAKYDFQVRALGSFILPMQEIITIIFAVLIFMGSLWIFGRDQIASAPALMVYFYIVMNATSKFGVISNFRGTLAASSGPLEEIMVIFDEENKFYVRGGETEFTGLKKEIAFHNLSFSYTGDRTVLHDVSFALPKSTMTAIVGETGSGKSTLIHLLMRYYDCPANSITIDGTDIREFSLSSYLQHVALVSQETLLLHTSLRENIIYGLNDVSEERLQEAVRRARLAEFIQELPEGLDTLIGDRGVKLSGGEKQRVSIARALLKGSEILILDEATSSLDSKTEHLIQEAIDEAAQGNTSIVIAHRLSTIQHADQIIVIDSGRVVEKGTIDELLAAKGTFHMLWEQQKFT